MLRHQKIHSRNFANLLFNCGINGCLMKNLVFTQLRSHLYNLHQQVYLENFIHPDFFVLHDSFICLPEIPTANSRDLSTDSGQYMQNNLTYNDNIFTFNYNYETQIKDFLSILVKGSFKKMLHLK